MSILVGTESWSSRSPPFDLIGLFWITSGGLWRNRGPAGGFIESLAPAIRGGYFMAKTISARLRLGAPFKKGRRYI